MPPSPPDPLPPPLRGAAQGSFAHDTVVRRMPDIARRVVAENDFPPDVNERLRRLIADIPDAPIRPLHESSAPDAAHWARCLAPYKGLNWLDAPWLIAEFYFYRRILEATGFYGDGSTTGVDPFAGEKQRGLDAHRADIGALAERFGPTVDADDWAAPLIALLAVDLWGNQADLSLWPAGSDGQPRHGDAAARAAHLLADDSPAVVGYWARRLAGGGPRRIDFLVDNAGFELVGDLLLADFLLRPAPGRGALAEQVTFHLKAQPTFVSDAMPVDVRVTVDWLAATEDAAPAALGARLAGHLADRRLRLRPDFVWNLPLAFWELPANSRALLGEADLVISKGDANYRRLLGDRAWPYDTPFAAVAGYFPAPLLALRTLKSEVAVGIPAQRLAALPAADPDWLTNGRWGVIQFVNTRAT